MSRKINSQGIINEFVAKSFTTAELIESLNERAGKGREKARELVKLCF